MNEYDGSRTEPPHEVMVEVTEARLQELHEAEAKLRALEAGGVDNWEGYDFAMEDL